MATEKVKYDVAADLHAACVTVARALGGFCDAEHEISNGKELRKSAVQELSVLVDQFHDSNVRIPPRAEKGNVADQILTALRADRGLADGEKTPGYLSNLMSDFRYAVRMMRRTPVFTFAIVVTVAIAIAAWRTPSAGCLSRKARTASTKPA